MLNKGIFGDLQVVERHPAPVKNGSRLSWLAPSGDPLYTVSAVRN